MTNHSTTPAPPDQDQRDLILNELDGTILVEAAAGTGKTTSLIGRMTALIRTGRCRVETMAAVTFTRKAAAEMRARFQVELERAARTAQGPEQERLLDALDHAERGFIGTIHSFCARLLRERPLEAGVSLAFRELEETEDRLMRDDVWNQYAASLHAQAAPILDELNRLGMSLNQLRGVYARMADYPDVPEWPCASLPLPDADTTRKELESYLHHIRELIPGFPAHTGNDALMDTYRRIVRLARHVDLSSLMGLFAVMEVLAKEKINVVQKEWPGGKVQAKDEEARRAAFRDKTAKPFVESIRVCRYPLVLQAVRPAIEMYEQLKTGKGLLNYQDLLVKTAALLRDKPHIRRYFRKRFTHLLVDEFQDTDPVQAEIMMLLTADDPAQTDWRACKPAPGALFVVGDPKQSIYRFRRADIVTYNLVKEIIERNGGRVTALSAGFRTIPALVDWINEVFASVFPEQPSQFAPQRRDLMKGRAGGAEGDLRGVRALVVPKDCQDPDAYEANLIARFIRHAIDTGMTVPRTEREQRDNVPPSARPEDFLIVTYKKNLLSGFAKELQALGIPHQVTGGAALNEIEELSLLRTCLSAATDPENPVALVAMLRGPLCGVSDTALYHFKKAGGVFHYKNEVPKKDLDPDDEAIFEKTFTRLRRYAIWLVTLPPVTAVEKIITDLGLNWRAGASDGGNGLAGGLARAVELLRMHHRSNPAPAALAEYLGQLVRGEETHDAMPARARAPSVVRVMNLHKAKGLEAPVVFLAGARGLADFDPALHVDRSGDVVRGHLAVYEKTEGFGKAPLLAMPANWNGLAEKEKMFEVAEKQRLLYVAATRAGTQLVITQKQSRNNSNPWKDFEHNLGDAELLSNPGYQKPLATAQHAETGASNAQAADALAAEAIDARWSAIREPTYSAGAAKQISLEKSATPHSRQEHGTEWGTVLHALLQAAMTRPGDDLTDLAGALLEEQNMDSELAQEARDLISAVIRSELWQRACRGSRRLTEVPFSVLLPREQLPKTDSLAPAISDSLVRGVMDLAFLEDGGWVIVDYKSDAAKDAAKDMDRLAEHYLPQIRTYAHAWQAGTKQPVKEIGLLFIRHGQKCEYRTWPHNEIE